MDKLEVIKLWHVKAENDLKICEQNFKTEEVITDVICFHCQQAVEKYLKSYLIYVEEDIKKTHNIAILLNNCESHDKDFSQLNDIAYLSEYAVQLRYPDDFFIPELDEAQKAFKDANIVKEFILNKINR